MQIVFISVSFFTYVRVASSTLTTTPHHNWKQWFVLITYLQLLVTPHHTKIQRSMDLQGEKKSEKRKSLNMNTILVSSNTKLIYGEHITWSCAWSSLSYILFFLSFCCVLFSTWKLLCKKKTSGKWAKVAVELINNRKHWHLWFINIIPDLFLSDAFSESLDIFIWLVYNFVHSFCSIDHLVQHPLSLPLSSSLCLSVFLLKQLSAWNKYIICFVTTILQYSVCVCPRE